MGETREIYDDVRKPIRVENPITTTRTGQDVCKFLHRLVTACHIWEQVKTTETTALWKISRWTLEVIAFTINLKDYLADLTEYFVHSTRRGKI